MGRNGRRAGPGWSGRGRTCRCGPRGWWSSPFRCSPCCWPRCCSGSPWPRTGGPRGRCCTPGRAAVHLGRDPAGGPPPVQRQAAGRRAATVAGPARRRRARRAGPGAGARRRPARGARAGAAGRPGDAGAHRRLEPDGDVPGLLGGSGERFVSGNVERRLGYTPEEVLNSPGFWLAKLHPEDREPFTDTLERAAAERAPQLEQEFRFLLGNGYRWLYSVTRLVYDDDGELVDTLGYAMDVTERRQAEAAVRERQATLQAVVEASPDVISILDAEGRSAP